MTTKLLSNNDNKIDQSISFVTFVDHVVACLQYCDVITGSLLVLPFTPASTLASFSKFLIFTQYFAFLFKRGLTAYSVGVSKVRPIVLGKVRMNIVCLSNHIT